jgi:hypothetical protein
MGPAGADAVDAVPETTPGDQGTNSDQAGVERQFCHSRRFDHHRRWPWKRD